MHADYRQSQLQNHVDRQQFKARTEGEQVSFVWAYDCYRPTRITTPGMQMTTDIVKRINRDPLAKVQYI